jgi:hypothetical protein
MKKLIKAILITGLCVSSVSRVLCEDGTISPCFPNKYEPIFICDTFRSLYFSFYLPSCFKLIINIPSTTLELFEPRIKVSYSPDFELIKLNL